MGKCPFCEIEIKLTDILDKKNRSFERERSIHGKIQMYSCPNCQKILGFSEYGRK